MINIISSSNFKTVPWKNGKGETTELAINVEGTLNNFDWRISIASVTENGIFSNFTDYQRNLVLIKGNGIELCHNDTNTDKLVNLLDFATFDGGNKTIGTIPNGAIKDFNIITKAKKYETTVTTHVSNVKEQLNQHGLTFIFSLSAETNITGIDRSTTQLAKGDLLMMKDHGKVEVCGEQLIIVNLIEKLK